MASPNGGGLASSLVSLRPTPSKSQDEDSLPLLISRIHEQRGHFRFLSEESLKKEIELAEDDQIQVDQTMSESEDVQDDSEERRKEINEARAEMIEFVSQAQQDALMAQDFVSLLLSHYAPKQAEQTISPALKQAVPIGSLGYDRTQLPKISQAEPQDDDVVARGRKLQSLTSAANVVLDRAKTLEKEIRRETRYWEQVLSTAEKGWSVTRLPAERGGLGVRFGFTEAVPQLRSRGFAALKANDNGDIILDQGIASTPKAIRVRIGRGTQIVGTSSHSVVQDVADLPVENLIHRARNSVFVEELFWEITREARTLFAQGVRLHDNIIELPLDGVPHESDPAHQAAETDRRVLIDLIPLDGDISEAEEQSSNDTANLISLSLRILLSHVHRQRFRQRTQRPAPLTEGKKTAATPIQSILRPILNHAHFQSQISQLQDMMKSIVGTLNNASLGSRFTMNPTISQLLLSAESTSITGTSGPDPLISTLIGPLECSCTLSLPMSNTLSIRLVTDTASPTFGTEYSLLLAGPVNSQGATSFRFSSLEELHMYIKHLIALEITQLIANKIRDLQKWKVSIRDNEFRRMWDGPGSSQRFRVTWEKASLVLLWTTRGGSGATGRYSWDAADVNAHARRSIIDVVSEAGIAAETEMAST